MIVERAEVERIFDLMLSDERVKSQNTKLRFAFDAIAVVSIGLLFVSSVAAVVSLGNKESRAGLAKWLTKPTASEELAAMRSKLDDVRQENWQLHNESKVKTSTVVDLDRRISHLERCTPYYCDFSLQKVSVVAGEHAGKEGIMQYCVNKAYLVEIDGKLVPLKRSDFEVKQKAVAEVAQ